MKVNYNLMLIPYSGPNFELMASARLTLDDINDGIRTHDLKLETSGKYETYLLVL